MNILVCGGAGYVGSHMVKCLIQAGHTPIVFDNLSSGHDWAVKAAFKYAEGKGITPVFIKGDMGSSSELDKVFEQHKIDAVMQFSARTITSDPLKTPELYYHDILIGSLNLMAAAGRAKVDKFIFSSSVSVYGTPEHMPIMESCHAKPNTPYGHATKMVEVILKDYAQAQGLKVVSLRYVNAAGACTESGLGEMHEPETHLIPNILKATLGLIPELHIYGNDYNTPDGTCIRDYVYVLDVAQAHLLALDYLNKRNSPTFEAFNIGTGKGYSILEVIAATERVTGHKVPYKFVNRRPCDSPVLVVYTDKAKRFLGWEPSNISLDEMIRTAWEWQKKFK